MFPPINNFGSCNLTFMIQPYFLPFIGNGTGPNPGGVMGNFLQEVSKLMNFRPIFKKSLKTSDLQDHLNEHNLNVIMNLIPRVPTVEHKYRFSLGLVNKVFIVPRSENILKVDEFLNPFDIITWTFIFFIFFSVTIICYTFRQKETMKILFDIYGILLGFTVGEFPNVRWFKCFLFFLLLPSYIAFQAYLANITINLSTPENIQEISTIDDLMMSNVDILCDEEITEHTCPRYKHKQKKLCDYCKNVTDEYLYNEFLPNLFRTAMLNNSAVEISEVFLKVYLNVRREVDVLSNDKISLNQFVRVRAGNNYIYEIEKTFRRFNENGILKKFVDRFSTYKGQFRKQKKYKMGFKLLYIIMIPGWTVALIAFWGEILVHGCLK